MSENAALTARLAFARNDCRRMARQTGRTTCVAADYNEETGVLNAHLYIDLLSGVNSWGAPPYRILFVVHPSELE
jgi:hypothetical protein